MAKKSESVGWGKAPDANASGGAATIEAAPIKEWWARRKERAFAAPYGLTSPQASTSIVTWLKPRSPWRRRL